MGGPDFAGSDPGISFWTRVLVNGPDPVLTICVYVDELRPVRIPEHERDGADP